MHEMFSRRGGERSGAVAVFLGVVVASLVALHNSRQAKDGKNVDISSSDETCKASRYTTTGEGCSCSNNRYQHACCHADACCEEESDNNHNINKKNTITVNESSSGGIVEGYDSSDSADGSDDEDSLDEYFQENAADCNIRDDFTTDDGRFKMVLLVNMKLGMGKGKIAAQCSHATLGAFEMSRRYCRSALKCWFQMGTAKIALKAADENVLLELEKKAMAAGLVTYLVHDAGHTQIAAGSTTVLAIGPAPYELCDSITGDLKLL